MKPIHIVLAGILIVGFLAAFALEATWRAVKLDDAFRHRCVNAKRFYEADGSCHGEVLVGDAPAKSKKAPGERSYADLAASCKALGGWLESTAGRDDEGPKCTVSGAVVPP